MPKKLPLFEIGESIGEWTVIAQMEKPLRSGIVVAFSRVRCACGAEREYANGYLRTGRSNGCGCRRAQRFAQRSLRHGKSRTPLYGIWASIKHRLSDERSYEGVVMFKPWVDDFAAFEAFIETLGPKPTPQHTLDRIECTGNYEPGNLRWADKATQSQNRTIVLNGVRKRQNRSPHLKCYTPTYRLWVNIKHRLKNSKSYAGIRMHGAWAENFLAFEAFIETLGPKPTPQHSLDRIECTGDYAPGNLRWADKTTQSENRRSNMDLTLESNSVVEVGTKYDMLTVLELVVVERHGQRWRCAKVQCDCGTVKTVYQKQLISGRTKSCGCLKDQNLMLGSKAQAHAITANGITDSQHGWARRTGISAEVIWSRINKLGWDPVRAVTEATRTPETITIDGVTKSVGEWAAQNGIPYDQAHRRMRSLGWDPIAAVTTPLAPRRPRRNHKDDVVQ
jgi:hypothetical protein